MRRVKEMNHINKIDEINNITLKSLQKPFENLTVKRGPEIYKYIF